MPASETGGRVGNVGNVGNIGIGNFRTRAACRVDSAAGDVWCWFRVWYATTGRRAALAARSSVQQEADGEAWSVHL